MENSWRLPIVGSSPVLPPLPQKLSPLGLSRLLEGVLGPTSRLSSHLGSTMQNFAGIRATEHLEGVWAGFPPSSP